MCRSRTSELCNRTEEVSCSRSSLGQVIAGEFKSGVGSVAESFLKARDCPISVASTAAGGEEVRAIAWETCE